MTNQSGMLLYPGADRLDDLDVSGAWQRGEIRSAFQPIVSLRTHRILGFEVLARWRDPVRGAIAPQRFLSLLEERGLLDAFTRQQVRQACELAAGWGQHFFLAFNVAPTQLLSLAFAKSLSQAVRDSGFSPCRVEIEVTEGALTCSPGTAASVLQRLADAGMTLSIDDFGTGHSNLARLVAYPFRKLKIDRQFIKDVSRSQDQRRIAAAIIGMAQNLEMAVVAEGVETREDADILKLLGCDAAQGWLYGRAMTPAQARALLASVGEALPDSRVAAESPFQQLHQLATLYAQAPVGLCFLDLGMRHVRVNDRFAAMHGLQGHQMEGRLPSEVTDPATAARIEQGLALVLAGEILPPVIFHGNGRDYVIWADLVKDVGGDAIEISSFSLELVEQRELVEHWLPVA